MSIVTPERNSEANLRPLQLFNLAFGVAIGIGWIMVMGPWLGSAGPFGAALAFGIAGMAMLTIGLAYAAVAIESPIAGGEFAYARRSFGLRTGFWVGWFLALAYVVVIAFEIVSLAWISRELIAGMPQSPASGLDLPGLAIGSVILVAVIAFNLRGAGTAARLQDFLVLLKVLLSVTLIVAGLWLGDARNFQPLWGAHPSGSWLRGMLTVLAMAPFFYAGFGVVAQALGEVRTPSTLRALPKLMIFVIMATMLFYVLIILASAAAAPRGLILAASLPAAAAFGNVFHSAFGAKLVLILGVLGLLTMLNGLYFAAVRLIQALAEAGLLPNAMAAPDQGARISRITGIFVAVAAVLLASLGKANLAALLNVTSMAISGVMGMVCASLIQQRRERESRMSHLISPIVGLSLALTMLSITFVETIIGSTLPVPPEWIIVVGWIAVGVLLGLRRSLFGSRGPKQATLADGSPRK